MYYLQIFHHFWRKYYLKEVLAYLIFDPREGSLYEGGLLEGGSLFEDLRYLSAARALISTQA